MDAWLRRGCPYVQKGSKGVEWVFNTATVARWTRDQAAADAEGNGKSDADGLALRRMEAETRLVELKLSTAMAEVVPMEQVQRSLALAFATVRSNLRNIPTAVASEIVNVTDESEIKAVLLREIDNALESLADCDLSGAEDEALDEQLVDDESDEDE